MDGIPISPYLWGVYTFISPICVDYCYVVVVVVVPAIAQDMVESFRQCFEAAGLSFGEVLLVNDLAPVTVLLICNVNFCRISRMKKG